MPGMTKKMKREARGGKAKTYPAKKSGSMKKMKSKSMSKKNKY